MQSCDHLRIAVVSIAVLCLAPVARADPKPEIPWYAGSDGHRRLLHLTIAATFGAAYIASETVLKSTFAPATCRWCEPPGFDRTVRNDIVWGNTGRANMYSNIDAYVLAPIVGFGLLVASDYDAGWARVLDDTIPVAETVAIGQALTQIIKFTVGRQRPDAHFDPNHVTSNDDNTSFISGHSVLGFSITAGAGLICHWRGYWTEPYVWGAGIALSLSTEYLRMSADKHYLTDVVAGGVVGIASGLLIPRLMRADLTIVPISNGAAVAGMF
jgi:hypothetical protein